MSKPKQTTLRNGEKVWKLPVYLGVDSVEGKKRRTTVTGRTSKEVKLKAARAKVEFEKNGFTTVTNIAEKEKAYTFEEIYDMWKIDYKYTVKESTYYKTMGHFRNHILPAYGHKNIIDITPLDCQRAVHTWSEKLKNPKLTNRYAGKVFDYALHQLRIMKDKPNENLSFSINKEIVEEPLDNFFTREELVSFEERLIEETKRTNTIKWRAFYRLLAYTGMRKGEALALTWNDVNLNRKEIRISKTVTRGEHNQLIIQPPKTEDSKRTIVIDDETLDILILLKSENHFLDSQLGMQSSDLLFRNTKNSWIDPNKINQNLNRIIQRYNLKRITPHGFRHTHITLLFLAGASIKEVQDRVGHSDVKTTMDIYNHVMQETREKTPLTFTRYVNGTEGS